jgi:hypothetical protein
MLTIASIMRVAALVEVLLEWQIASQGPNTATIHHWWLAARLRHCLLAFGTSGFEASSLQCRIGSSIEDLRRGHGGQARH